MKSRAWPAGWEGLSGMFRPSHGMPGVQGGQLEDLRVRRSGLLVARGCVSAQAASFAPSAA